MAIITEDYVSFETAKLLKEKGFDVPCNCYGAYNGVNLIYRLCITDKYTNWNKHTNTFIISCPTLQIAMKWLRESHNLYIEPYVIKNYDNKKLEYTYSIQDLDFNGSDDGIECCKNWNSPEEACEAAIKYCLENLI